MMAQQHQDPRARPVHAGDHVGGQEPDHHGADDADAAHGRRARLGDVDLRAVLADLLADVVLQQPPDQDRRRQDGDPQRDAARGHEGDHRRRLPAAPNRSARAARRLHPVVEGHDDAARRLGRLVPLAGQQHHVTGPGQADRHPDGRRAVGLHDRPSAGPVHPGPHLGSMMATGSSDRGLSEVRTTTSASSVATAPISGRLPWSRSPPQPNTHTHPSVAGQRPHGVAAPHRGRPGVWA